MNKRESGLSKGEARSCLHNYCDTYAWIVKRAEAYARITGETPDQVITKWESHRECDCMNCYQDYLLPLPGKKVRVYDSADEAVKGMGNEFVCNSCGRVTHNAQVCECGWSACGLLQSKYVIYLKDTGEFYHVFHPKAWDVKKNESEAGQ